AAAGPGAVARGQGTAAAAAAETAFALLAAVKAAVHGPTFAARRRRLQLRVLADQQRLRVEHHVIAFLETLVHFDHLLVAAAEFDLAQDRLAVRIEDEALPLQARGDVAHDGLNRNCHHFRRRVVGQDRYFGAHTGLEYDLLGLEQIHRFIVDGHDGLIDLDVRRQEIGLRSDVGDGFDASRQEYRLVGIHAN